MIWTAVITAAVCAVIVWIGATAQCSEERWKKNMMHHRIWDA